MEIETMKAIDAHAHALPADMVKSAAILLQLGGPRRGLPPDVLARLHVLLCGRLSKVNHEADEAELGRIMAPMFTAAVIDADASVVDIFNTRAMKELQEAGLTEQARALTIWMHTVPGANVH